MKSKTVRVAGIAGVVVALVAFWMQTGDPDVYSLIAGLLAILALVSPEAVEAFPIGPSKD